MTKPKTTRHLSRLVVILLTALVMPLGAVATASPASADVGGCSRDSGGSKALDGDASYVSYQWDCSSSGIRVWGTVHDDTCDARAAKASVAVKDHLFGGIYQTIWVRTFQAENGCGTWGTFDVSGVGSNDGKLEVCTWAENGLGSSSKRCHTWTLW
jgi:hypothetical protein